MARFFITPLLLAGLTAGCSDSGVSKVAEVEEETDADEGPPEEPFSTDWGQWLSMTTTPDGKPAITFYDRDRGGVGSLSRRSPTERSSGPSRAWTAIQGPADLTRVIAVRTPAYFRSRRHRVGVYYDVVLRAAVREATQRWAPGQRASPTWWGLVQRRWALRSIAIGADGTPIIAHHDRGRARVRVNGQVRRWRVRPRKRYRRYRYRRGQGRQRRTVRATSSGRRQGVHGVLRRR